MLPIFNQSIPEGSVAFDQDAFDEAIRAHGVQFIHYRGMRSPGGLVDKYDSRRPEEDHVGGSNGFVYTKAGQFTGLMIGNSKNQKGTPQGLLDMANCQMTSPKTYDCGKLIYLAPFDRLYLAETSVLVVHWQLVEPHPTGTDKLRFQAIEVQDLIDSDGVRYTTSDYCVTHNGQIKWLTQKRPGMNPDTGKGKVYTVRYLYRPYWYIDRLVHEIRMTQQENPLTGERTTIRMPQTASLQREYVFENEEQDSQLPDSPRQAPVPEDGQFGPR
jgi:hypothetical protein